MAVKTKKGKKNNGVLLRLTVRGMRDLFLLLAGGLLLYSSLKDLGSYASLKMKIEANTMTLEQLQSQKDDLESTKKKLTNPDYLEFLARGKYHVSKEDEQVFVFPSLDEQTGP